MVERPSILDHTETRERTDSNFYRFVIPGNCAYDSGDIHLVFPEFATLGLFTPDLHIKMNNFPKENALHTADFALVTVRTVNTHEKGYPLIVIDAVCIDGLFPPDFSGEGLPYDAQASKILIDAANAYNFRKNIERLGDLDDFVYYNPSLRHPYYGKARTFGLKKDWKIITTRGNEFNVKTHLRNKYMQWMVNALRQKVSTEEQPIHWYTGVYGIFHIVCDPSDKLFHYLFLSSGDVEGQLIRNRHVRELHEDVNWAADMMGATIGIQGVDRYPGKVYRIYDAVGPKSNTKMGPFTTSIGYEKGTISCLLRSDGYLAKPGEDDVTSISISADLI